MTVEVAVPSRERVLSLVVAGGGLSVRSIGAEAGFEGVASGE